MIIIAGALLSLVDIGGQSLWLDEAYTWFFVRLDWARALKAVQIDAVNPPLYYLFVKVLTPGTELSEVALRLPSTLAHILGIMASMYLGYSLGGEAGGVAAGLVWATHPFTVWASRDARPYALAAAVGVGAVAAFVALRSSMSTRVSAAAVVTLALGLITHYFFFVLSAGLILLALINIRRSPALFRRWTILTLIAMIPLAIWLAFYFSQGSPSLGIGWIRMPSLSDIPLTLWNVVSGYAGVFDIASLAFGIIVIVAFGLALFFGEGALATQLAVAGLLIPVVVVWVISQRRPVYVDRYFIVLMPLVVSLVALGVSAAAKRISWSRGRWVVVSACALVALVSGISVHLAWKFEKEDWRELVEFQQSQGSAAASYSVSEPEITLPLSYYGLADVDAGLPPLIPTCGTSCWWILRQPYTATHALTQSVRESGRADAPAIPDECSQKATWQSLTGVSAWELQCQANGD
jgi:uncharacterized membrane protein